MSKCQKKRNKNSQREEYGIFQKIIKMLSESFIRALIAIFWICVLWVCASIFYHILELIWFILFLPVNPLTNYLIWLPFGMLLKIPFIAVPIFTAGCIGAVFYVLYLIRDNFLAKMFLQSVFDALNDARVWDLFDTLDDGELTASQKFMKIIKISPFFKTSEPQELTMDDIVGCNEFDTQLFKALMNLFILKEDGVYVNNMAKLKIAEDKKVKGAKNMVKITNDPNRLTEQQRINIEKCISQSVKTNANKSNAVDVLENMYKNEIIKNNCVKKYDGSNRKPSDPSVDNAKTFMKNMKKSSDAANRTMKKILNNDIDL